MVLEKRINFGFNGYQVPFVPRGPRSFRRRGPLRKKVVDNQMCAFDLLATVAGEILFEGLQPAKASGIGPCNGGSTPGNVKEEQHIDDEKILNIDSCNKICSEVRVLVDEHSLQVHNQPEDEIASPLGGLSSVHASSAVATSDFTNMIDDGKKCYDGGCQSGKELFQSQPVSVGEPSFVFGSNACSLEDQKLLDPNSSASVRPDSDVNAHLHRNHNKFGSPSLCRSHVNLVGKDDDENSSQSGLKSTAIKTMRSPPRIGDRRIKKLLAYRNWRAPTKVKGVVPSDTDRKLHFANQNRKISFMHQRSQNIYPFKKRKVFYSSPSTSDGRPGCDYNGNDTSASDFHVSGHGAITAVPGAACPITSFASRDPHVKLRIKSFRVPELLVELPETATVGSLKKTVMDAITTLIGGGLRIGVLVKGREIRDDNRSLVQIGVSRDNTVEALAFALEPCPSQAYTVCSEEPSTGIPQPLPRSFLGACITTHQGTHSPEDKQANIFANIIKCDHNLVPCPAAGILTGKETDNYKPVTAVQAPADVLPPHLFKRPKTAQRRIRRPFSVAEVETLVQAVEKLGTGRWLEVKLKAFDNRNYRTYVDLKDKWKTLVHTAKINPLQRRGEPVPQELLDRVLAAHANWS